MSRITSAVVVTSSETMQPLLYFYKYLQPLPDGRKLSLRLPLTVVCEKVDGREYVLWLASDLAGNVVTEDKGTTWRKRLLAELTGGKFVVEATGDGNQDEVIAVRNVAYWRSSAGSNNQRKFNDSSVAEFNDPTRPPGTSADAALQHMIALSPPVADGLDAVKRIVDHTTAHLPGLHIRELTADFVKDALGSWWCIRIVGFDAAYRMPIPMSVQELPDSAVFIHESIRSL
ncbi:hypothetical protein ATCC90586_000589 [Pythium insidiosum]|nr:hypothetical protein ATCC90586_000589 [Pythium insidiosum]